MVTDLTVLGNLLQLACARCVIQQLLPNCMASSGMLRADNRMHIKRRHYLISLLVEKQRRRRRVIVMRIANERWMQGAGIQ